MGLFKFSISSHLSFGSVWVFRNLSISSRLSSLLAYNFSYYSLIIVCISEGLVVINPFSFVISFTSVLSLFLLRSLARGLSILFIFSKNQLLVSLICPTVFFVFCFLFFFWILYFCCDLYYFSSSAGFRLSLLFCFYFLLWKTVWRFFKNLKIELHYYRAITQLGIYPKNTKH